MDQVYVGGSYFHIYVSILKQLSRPDTNSKSLFILNDFCPNVESIIPLLKASGYFTDVIQVPFASLKNKIKQEQHVVSRILNRNKLPLEYVERHSGILKHESFIRQAEINLFHKGGLSQAYFILKYGRTNFIRMLEDGENNYYPRTGRLRAFRKGVVLNTMIGDGLDPEIREIHVQHVHRLDRRVRHKGKTLALETMRNNLGAAERNNIVNLFMQGKNIEADSDNNLLLITQPWSEDKFINETAKVEIYNRMLEQYNGNRKIFLKAHPRDRTDYRVKLKFPFIEIPRAFPLEMLDLMENIKFRTGLTVSSSALHNLHCVKEKIFTGNSYLKQV